MAQKNSAIDVRDTEWTEYNHSSQRHERLTIGRDGEELHVPITNIDHPEFPRDWDAERVYTFDGRIIAEAELDDGTVWTIEESGRTSSGDLAFDGHAVENPTDEEVADEILWERE